MPVQVRHLQIFMGVHVMEKISSQLFNSHQCTYRKKGLAFSNNTPRLVGQGFALSTQFNNSFFDRDKGTPLFPVKEIPVPVIPALPGEKPWPTQPIPVKPAPFSNQVLTKDDITTGTPEAHKYVLDRFINSRHGSKYLLPSTKGTLFYGFGGGAEWGWSSSRS